MADAPNEIPAELRDRDEADAELADGDEIHLGAVHLIYRQA